jgi:hypothetical protein
MSTGLALQMQLELSRLSKRHGVAPKPHFVALADPVDGPVTVTGLASTTDIDVARQKFRAYAFDNLCLHLKGYPLPKLLYRHDANQVAGTITSLGYDDRGNLKISAEVDHPLGKRCGAFSVAGIVLD